MPLAIISLVPQVLSRPFAHAVAGFTTLMKFHEKIEMYELIYEPATKEEVEVWEMARTKIRVNRENWFNADHVHGIKVDVTVSGAKVGDKGDVSSFVKVACEDKGQRVVVDHDKDMVKDGDDEISIRVTIHPCLVRLECTC